ncbi:hypothetical protein MKX03_007323 [Papaver bracteatum]|nr:hypothetical protein MKX03_007323 [Papaver bracteatum]
MALQNIGAGNSGDAFYRYKMPRMLAKIEGRGNGIKTNVVNMVDIAKALARPASYTTKYFGYELGAQSKFDEKTGVALVNGAHDTAKLAGLLDNFIKKFVQCYGCGNPETEVIITKTKMIQLKCAACGFVSDVDMRDKLTAFIVKNPPAQKKGGKYKKAFLLTNNYVGQLKSFLGSLNSAGSSSQDVMHALIDALFGGLEKGFSEEVTKNKNYLAAATHDNEGSQILLLRAIGAFCEKSGPEIVKEIGLVLKTLYDEDVLEEEYIVQWFNERIVPSGSKNSQIWKNVKPFIVWLQSAESESE